MEVTGMVKVGFLAALLMTVALGCGKGQDHPPKPVPGQGPVFAPEGAAASPPVPGLVDVGWWNIRDFSLSSARSPALQEMAKSLRDMEVVAVGELNDPAALEALARTLGPEWKCAATPKVGRTSGSREHYGFLWNSAVMEQVGGLHTDPDADDRIDREPGWATFRTKDHRLDFTVICVHITWGTSVEKRKAEIGALPSVWARVQSATPGDDDLILVGDFNRNSGDDSFDPLLAVPGMQQANKGTEPTSVTSTSTYDQVFLCSPPTTEWAGTFGVRKFDQAISSTASPGVVNKVSDHRPVWVTLRVPERDDD